MRQVPGPLCVKPSKARAGAAPHRRPRQCRTDARPGDGERTPRTTLLDVPIIAVNADADMRLQNGRLADVTPTLLDLLGMAKPPQMTGRSLLEPEYGMQKTEIGP